MKHPFLTETVRSIAASKARFVAILLIVALGCGFFAGLQMTGADMRQIAHDYYNQTDLYDLRVVSTLGLEKPQIEKLASIDEVKKIEANHTIDVMGVVGEQRYTMRIQDFDEKAAQGNASESASYAKEGYLNRLVLESGRWPQADDECLAVKKPVSTSALGLGDTVEVLFGAQDLKDVLAVKKFKVVGLVTDPLYVDSMQLGYTNLGAGLLDQALFVSPSAFKKDFPYTQAYLTVRGVRDYVETSAEYKDIVSAAKQKITAIKDELATSRKDELQSDAQAALDEKIALYQDNKNQTEKKLTDAKAQLEAAQKKLITGQKQLDQGYAQFTDGQKQFNQERAHAQAQLAQAKATLNEKTQELMAAKARIPMSESELAHAQAKLAEQSRRWEASKPQLTQALPLFEATGNTAQGLLGRVQAGAVSQAELMQAQAALTQCDQKLQYLGQSAVPQELKGLVSDTTSATSTSLNAINACLADLNSTGTITPDHLSSLTASLTSVAKAAAGAQSGWTTYINQKEAQFKAAQDHLNQVQQALAQIKVGEAQLAQARSQLQQQEAMAQGRLQEAQAKLFTSKQTLDSKRAELLRGKQVLATSWAEFDSESKTAQDALDAAKAKLDDAQATIDDIAAPDIYVLDRDTLVGTALYQADSERIDAIATVFPWMFFLVAALVSLTTMTRMVEEERILIGTHKALGFSKSYIAAKYLAYAALASGIGAAVGIAVCSQVLPLVIAKAYGIVYAIPTPEALFALDPVTTLLAFGIGVGICLLATLGAVGQTLKESPAALLLPKAPRPGKRILLERLPIWKRLSFSWKVTLRNLFRYKRRLFMTIVGIAGCCGLILVGLGLHDSIWDIIERQYEGTHAIFAYNMTVELSDDASASQVDACKEKLAELDPSSSCMAATSVNMQVGTPGSDTTHALRVIIPDKASELDHFIRLQKRKGASQLTFTDDSCILTEKIAAMLKVSANDPIELYNQDTTGVALKPGYAFTVDAITENYVYHYAYIGASLWQKTTGETPHANTLLCKVSSDPATQKKLVDTLRDVPAVKAVQFDTDIVDAYKNSMASVNMIVGVLVVAAAALAFIVLYNLTYVNISERVREIASLKVLGFTQQEVSAYVFREIIISVIMGALVGLVFGTVLENFVVVSAETEAVMFGRIIHLASYALAFALTLLFSAVVMWTMKPKLRKINMVESLKSVD